MIGIIRMLDERKRKQQWEEHAPIQHLEILVRHQDWNLKRVNVAFVGVCRLAWILGLNPRGTFSTHPAFSVAIANGMRMRYHPEKQRKSSVTVMPMPARRTIMIGYTHARNGQ